VSERGPDFEAIVGADLGPDEHDRLLRVHEALVAAGPPPETAELASAPSTAEPEPISLLPAAPRRRRGALVALAAALGVLVFAVGAVVGSAWDEPGTFETITMTGTPAAEGATASIVVFDLDAAGNWPMEVRVSGLRPGGRPYQLWVTRGGELAELCGSFLAAADGTTVVPMNAPFRLDEIDGWVVVEEGSRAPVLTT
jgi:hypothetical protein